MRKVLIGILETLNSKSIERISLFYKEGACHIPNVVDFGSTLDFLKISIQNEIDKLPIEEDIDNE